MKIADKKILVISPHVDDVEFGMGATVSMLSECNEIYYLAFSTCDESLPEGFPAGTLKTECLDAVQKLGVKQENCHILDYKVRYFSDNRQQILEDLIVFKRQFNPDLVFCPMSTDVHQDHSTIQHEAYRAFKMSCVLGYELPWNNTSVQHNCYIHLEKHYLENKIKALHCYLSQAHRQYMSEDYIYSLARVRGIQINKQYAEMFEVLKWVM